MLVNYCCSSRKSCCSIQRHRRLVWFNCLVPYTVSLLLLLLTKNFFSYPDGSGIMLCSWKCLTLLWNAVQFKHCFLLRKLKFSVTRVNQVFPPRPYLQETSVLKSRLGAVCGWLSIRGCNHGLKQGRICCGVWTWDKPLDFFLAITPHKKQNWP